MEITEKRERERRKNEENERRTFWTAPGEDYREGQKEKKKEFFY